MRNYFTLDGVDSRDFGVYISGQGTFNASGRDYNIIPVPGRNGDLVGPEKRFLNGTLTYPAFIYANFKQQIEAFRNFLLSLVGYHDLIDSYHPNEIRKVLFEGPFEADVEPKNDAGRFDIEFNCKPQRYLASGNEVTTFDSAGETETLSGSIITFDNPDVATVNALSTAINPIQNLHGYDNPWPAGGGVNKLQVTATTKTNNGVTFTVNDDGTVLVNGTASGGNAIFELVNNDSKQALIDMDTELILSGCPSGGSTKGYRLQWYLYETGKTVADIGNGTNAFKPVITNGNIAIIVNNGTSCKNLVFKPMIRLATETDATFAPYSNICPISGWTGANVYRTGVNVWDEECELGSIDDATGAKVNSTNSIRAKNYVPVLPNTNYYAKGFIKGGLGIFKIYFYALDKSFVGSTASPSFTTPSNAHFILFRMYSIYGTTYNHDISINYPSSDHDYHAYQGSNTVTLSWQTEAGTVYGGTLDVTAGTLTVTHTLKTYNGSENWEYIPADAFAWFTLRGITPAPLQSNQAVICNIFSSRQNSPWLIDNYCWQRYGQIHVRPDANISPSGQSASGLSEFKTWLASNNMQVVYELASPITIQLDPVQIAAISGQTNNVWANTGDITATIVFPQYQFTITNPTLFDSQPLLRVYGTGILGIDSQQITITQADVYTDIDCEMMDCFKGTSNKNPYVQFTDHNFPVLKPGTNNFSLGTGITKVEITPRWWQL